MADPVPQPPMQTLNAVDAHQALAAVISMYTGIIADGNRERAMMQLQIAQLRARIKELEKPPVPDPQGAP
jgi:hypothetical protein